LIAAFVIPGAPPAMPTETDNRSIVRLTEAILESIRDSREERREVVNEMHKISINVATLAANSESEKGHRLALEQRLEKHETATLGSINGLRHDLNEASKEAASKNVKVGVLWSGLTAACLAAAAFAWNTITGKGG
jgi:hypothetical protein